MSTSSRRAVVTGIGVINPIGQNATAFAEALARGQSGIRAIQAFDPSALPCRIAGEVANFDPKKFIAKDDRKSLRVMARAIQLAVCAAQLALDDARVVKEKLDPTRFGVEFGAGLLPTELPELGPAAQLSTKDGAVDMKKWGEHGIESITPLWMLKYLPNMMACHVSILHNAQGPNNTITESDVASLLALGEAYRVLRRNQADVLLVGGADSRINPLSMVRQCLFGNLTHRNEEPEKACRPFERQRDGTVLGEGAGVLVLEDLEHARRRGAPIYAEVVGFAAAFDRSRSGSGPVRTIRAALGQAGVRPEDIDHINANGLGSVKLDAYEAAVLHEVFGPCRPPVPVCAVKSAIGNLGAASCLNELAASVLACKQGTLPATLNYDEPDPACPVAVTRAPLPVRKAHFLKIGFTEMGQCAAAVCRKWNES
jgi:3-oxoacyl-[acyl-carrier-protein] synthase II